jgi:excinuclease ABC subunit C
LTSPPPPEDSAFDPKAFAATLSHKPGVYRMLDAGGAVIYVGKARDLRRRVTSYFSGKATDAKTMAMVRVVAAIEVTVTRTETEALLLEYNLIKEHRPRYNVLLRDDKSYPWIRISTEQEFPRISFYRGAKPKQGRIFGPYPNAASVRSTINLLERLFQLRNCEESMFRNRSRPCMQHQIRRCTAPCVGLISAEDYGRDVADAMSFLRGDSGSVVENVASRMERAADSRDYELAARYRDQLRALQATQAEQLVTRGSVDCDIVALAREGAMVCIAVLMCRGGRLLGGRNHFPQHAGTAADDDVMRAFLLQYYGGREAPAEILVDRKVDDAEGLASLFGADGQRDVQIRWRLRGDRSRWVAMAATNAREGAAQQSRLQESVGEQLDALGTALALERRPERIECYDISHTAGEGTVASCVVFGPDGPLKSGYRRFNIADVEAGDDYAAMRQVLQRRFRQVPVPGQRPDVVLIDGGRGQLSAAARALEEQGVDGVLLVGVAKGQGRRPGRETLHLAGQARPLRLDPASAALHLVQLIRDEAHRFALAGHRGRRQKAQRQSPLDAIAGLGPKRRQALIRHFGGLKALARAGVDDLVRVRGISRGLAERVYGLFHAD